MTRRPWQVISDGTGEDGFTLVELLIAVFMLAVAMIALAGVATSSLLQVRVARDRQRASDLASATIEDARGLDFEELALDLSGAPASGPPGYTTEPVVTRTDGIAHEQAVEGRFTVRTWVTRLPVDADKDPRKRIFVTVTWDDRAGSREVTATTIATPAERGLPVPQFDLELPTNIVTFVPGSGYTTESAPTPTSAQHCITHTLTNLGAPDRYAWRLVNRNDSSAVKVTDAANGAYTDSSKKWRARAYFEIVPTSGGGSPTLDSTTAMTDLEIEASAPHWMESPSGVVLPSKRSAWLTVCYWTTDSAGAQVGNVQDYLVRVRSAFDPAVRETSVDRITVADDPLVLHLHENISNHGNNWSGEAHKRRTGNTVYPPMPMDELGPQNGTLVHDMDNGNNEDTTGTHGLWLPIGSTAAAAVWDYPIQVTRELSSASVSLWSRVSTSGSAPVLGYALERVSTNGTLIAGITSGTQAFSGNTTDWQLVEWGASVSAVLNAGEVLRLRVWCHSTSTAACHVDMDSTSRDSTLTVTR